MNGACPSPLGASRRLARLIWSAAFVAVVVTAGACEPLPKAEVVRPDPWAISLQPKGSCLARGDVPYNLSCLTVLSFEFVPLDGGDSVRRCYRFGEQERPTSLFSVLQRGQFFSSGLSTPGDYIVRVRGLHDKNAVNLEPIPNVDAGVEDNCAGLELQITDSRRWLLWGESNVITFVAENSDGGPRTVEVPVRVECRNCAGGCDAIGTATCPARFPPSYCAPSDNANTCRRLCSVDQSCFDGEVLCNIEDGDVEGRCDPDGDGQTAFCRPCVTAADCPPEGHNCVGTANNRFCSRPCPTGLCPSGAVCKQVNLDILVYE